MSNRIVVDLSKVQWASYYYKNQYGLALRKKPKLMTVHGVHVSPFDVHHFEKIPMTVYAERHGLKDVWTPVLRLQLTANHSLTYTGKKATSIWKEWNKRQFKKKE